MKSSWPRKLNNWQNPTKILKKLNKEEKLLKNLSDKLRNKDKRLPMRRETSKKEKLPTSLENKWLKKENKKLLQLKKLPRKRLRLLRNKQPLLEKELKKE